MMVSHRLPAGTRRQRPRWEHPSPRSFWHSLDAAERSALAAAAEDEIFGAGSTLCRQDDSRSDVMVIRSGWAKVSVDIDSRERIVALRGAGDVVGERATLTPASRSATVAALNDVVALVIPAERFRTVLDDHPRIVEVLERQENERLTDDAYGMFRHENANVRRRLASLLVELALRRGDYEHDGAVTITLPMSREDLADWVDAAPDVVTRCLNSWSRDRTIRITRHGVSVVDAAALEKTIGRGGPARAVPRTDATAPPATRWVPSNCSIMFTDIAGFGDLHRYDDDRRIMREALYRILQETFAASNVPWMQCLHEDRGDGTLTVVPPTIPTASLVDPLIALLAAKLRRHNRQAGDPVRIQLRAALHVGPVSPDRHGLCGHALIHAARMLDAPIVKHALAATGADLAFITSGHVYETVIQHAVGLVDPAAYRQVRVPVKETSTIGWMYLAGTRSAHPTGVEPLPLRASQTS